jgi:hypothetical protein
MRASPPPRASCVLRVCAVNVNERERAGVIDQAPPAVEEGNGYKLSFRTNYFLFEMGCGPPDVLIADPSAPLERLFIARLRKSLITATTPCT